MTEKPAPRRVEGLFSLRAPLSHISESISTTSYLVQERVLQDDGSVEDVFCYSGNAWRGQLRDLAATYMLDKIGSSPLGMDAFHLLFSGGRIGGAQSVDIEQARRVRAAVPMVALFGGGVGNQILSGKLHVGNSYPLCREALPLLPSALHARAARVAYADCTMEKEHSRRDDAKIEGLRRHLAAHGRAEPGSAHRSAVSPDEAVLLGPAVAASLPGKAKPARAAKTDPDAPGGGAADQMRFGIELVCPGVRLYTWIALDRASDVELGALVSALHLFSASPSIGGKVGIGYGLVDLEYRLVDAATGEARDFVRVSDGRCLLAPPAAEAKAAYDEHLRSLYDAHLADGASRINGLLGAA